MLLPAPKAALRAMAAALAPEVRSSGSTELVGQHRVSTAGELTPLGLQVGRPLGREDALHQM